MARPSKPRHWRRPTMPAAPFTPDEDRELARMVGCGLAVDYYHVGLPDRPLGQLLERRLQLIAAGVVRRPALL